MFKLPTVVMALSGAVFSIILGIIPFFEYIKFPFTLIGILISLTGFAVIIWSMFLYKENGTPINETEKPNVMITTGPFKFTRNPIYLGELLILIGVAFIVGNLLSFISPIVYFISINFYYLPEEENVMEQTFGADYLGYKHSARRWL